MSESDPLSLVPACPPVAEVACTKPAEVQAGDNLLVVDPSTKCNRSLANRDNSIPWSDGVEVKMRTGAIGSEIFLPSLMDAGPSFPYVAGLNDAGALLKSLAPEDCRDWGIIGRSGSWNVELIKQSSCWEEICEDTPTQFAGFVINKDCNGVDNYCLVRFDDETLAGFVVVKGSNCIGVTGAGTTDNPYVITAKISNDPNNCIVCRVDGLFVECGGIYGDPLA